MEAGIAAGIVREQGGGIAGGAAFDGDDFKIGRGLGEEAVEGVGEGWRGGLAPWMEIGGARQRPRGWG